MTRSKALISPRQFGPQRRIEYSRAIALTDDSSARPAGPVSAKPELKTIADLTPRCPRARNDSATNFAGTATIARSMSRGSSSIAAKQVVPLIDRYLGLTG